MRSAAERREVARNSTAARKVAGDDETRAHASEVYLPIYRRTELSHCRREVRMYTRSLGEKKSAGMRMSRVYRNYEGYFRGVPDFSNVFACFG